MHFIAQQPCGRVRVRWLGIRSGIFIQGRRCGGEGRQRDQAGQVADEPNHQDHLLRFPPIRSGSRRRVRSGTVLYNKTAAAVEYEYMNISSEYECNRRGTG